MSDSSVISDMKTQGDDWTPGDQAFLHGPPPGSTSILLHSILSLKSALIASSAAPNQAIRHFMQVVSCSSSTDSTAGGWIPTGFLPRSHTRCQFIPLSFILRLKSAYIALPAAPTQTVQLSCAGGLGGSCSFRQLQIRMVSQGVVWVYCVHSVSLGSLLIFRVYFSLASFFIVDHVVRVSGTVAITDCVCLNAGFDMLWSDDPTRRNSFGSLYPRSCGRRGTGPTRWIQLPYRCLILLMHTTVK